MDDKDTPMPSGVEDMSKQQLWNWFHRCEQAAAEQGRLKDRFFFTTTGLHPARSHLLGNPAGIIEEQRKRMRGLELQMGQMQRGYETKLRKALAAMNSHPHKELVFKNSSDLRSEDIEQAVKEVGFTRVVSCCEVPLKFCSTDQWKGELRAFSVALLRIVNRAI